MDKSTIGAYIRHRRQQRGLTVRDLAGFADIRPNSLSDIERGVVTNPRLGTLVKILRVLDVTPAHIFEIDFVE